MSAWIEHVKKVQKSKGLTWQQALKEAKKTYRAGNETKTKRKRTVRKTEDIKIPNGALLKRNAGRFATLQQSVVMHEIATKTNQPKPSLKERGVPMQPKPSIKERGVPMQPKPSIKERGVSMQSKFEYEPPLDEPMEITVVTADEISEREERLREEIEKLKAALRKMEELQ